MSTPMACDKCGEWDDNHICQGSPNDRITALEERVADLEARMGPPPMTEEQIRAWIHSMVYGAPK